jgi:hypothetical protein
LIIFHGWGFVIIRINVEFFKVTFVGNGMGIVCHPVRLLVIYVAKDATMILMYTQCPACFKCHGATRAYNCLGKCLCLGHGWFYQDYESKLKIVVEISML